MVTLTVRACRVVQAGEQSGSEAYRTDCKLLLSRPDKTYRPELILSSPLYTQTPAISSVGAGLDSVCMSLTATNTPDNALVEMVNVFTNKTVLRRASIQTTIDTDSFFVVGPTRAYKDFILGNPCPGTYVIYRCLQTGTCVTDANNADVFVASCRPRDRPSCINRGLAIIQRNFPGIKNFILPRTMCPRCKKSKLVSLS
ncbi:hypothetical protein J6590_052527 [Homalodisca vitripennis]|nr:hypothetical protein J6590_052527 [Homalodisca vitripennis]